MRYQSEQFLQDKNPIAQYYQRSRVADRILLLGQQFQAWPDASEKGHNMAWQDAVSYVEEKWDKGFHVAEEVRQGYAKLMNTEPWSLALAGSLQELLVRLLSALLQKRRRIVFSDGECHSVRRQILRLRALGVECIEVAAEPVGSLPERLLDRVDDRTAVVFVSTVMFASGHTVFDLDEVQLSCEKAGVELVVDISRTLNVFPFDVEALGLQNCWLIGSGESYCQLGEGVAFLRIPRHGESLEPAVTGWFGYFDACEDDPCAMPVVFPEGHSLFEGFIYDTTACYRAKSVFEFFDRRQLTADLLYQVNRKQVNYLIDSFDKRDFDPEIIHRDSDRRQTGGFLSLETAQAKLLCGALRDRGVHCTWYGERLSMGPAPYNSTEQLGDAIEALEESVLAMALKH